NGLAVGADGTVTDTVGVRACYGTEHDEELAAAERQRLVDACVADINQIVRKAADVDADLGRLFASIEQGRLAALDSATLAGARTQGFEAGDAARSVLPPPGDGGAPAADNAGWWAGLSDAEREQIIAAHPDWIGNLDGVDFRARDRANRELLDDHRAALERERADLERQLHDLSLTEKAFGSPHADELWNRLQENKDKQASLDTVDRVLARGGRQLVGLDLGHGRAQGVIAVGDLSTADHVAVFTPGLTSTVQGIEGNDQRMAELKRETEKQLSDSGETGTVATVTWVGYQAPQLSADSLFSSNSVALDEAARDGGRDLAEFYRGINASRATDPDLTAIGHSYGSTTTGFALREDTGVDRAAFVGSPGLGTDSLTDLRVPTGQSYYGEATWDGVGDFGRFGTDPSDLAGMRHLETREATAPDGTHLDGVRGHTSYLQDRSTSQYNLAVLAAGHPELVIEGRNVGITG
ncbi:MAG: alpha/beta hydrolase, partial [Kineosporiaceae bacterium]